MISAKKLNLHFSGRIFKLAVSRANFRINKYHTRAHMQLPVILSMLAKSLEVLFHVSIGSGKFQGMFLKAIAMTYSSFTTNVFETGYGILAKGIVICNCHITNCQTA